MSSGASVGWGAFVRVVEMALQSSTIVAGAGPAWMGLHPGSLSRSVTLLREIAHMFSLCKRKRTLTFGHFVDLYRLPAVIHLLCALPGEDRTVSGDAAPSQAGIHRSLERVTLPTEDVVGVLSEPSSANPVGILRYQKEV